MQYTEKYNSPLGEILLACDEIGLTGLWFDREKYYALSLDPDHEERETDILRETHRWLDIYFAGKEPDFFPSIHMLGTRSNSLSVISSGPFPMERRPHTEKLQRSLPKMPESRICLPRLLAAPSDTMKFPSSSHVTASSERTAVLPAMPEVSTKKLPC